MLVLVLVIFSLCLNFSKQDLLYELALEQGLNFTEAEAIREFEKHGIKRQAPFKSKSGIPQTKICGINGQSASRLRRQDSPDERPQGKEDWPWMALFLLKDGGDWFCGGSLLNSRYVLTAAHCFDNDAIKKDKDKFYVRLGEFDINEEGETKIQNFEVEELIIHEDYDKANNQNDITVVKLNQTVEYNQFVRPICLPAPEVEPRPDEDVYVAGWGRTEENAQPSHLLLYVDVPVWDHEECVDAMRGQTIHETNICAAPKEGGKDSCKRDSGGPLMYQGNGKRWESVGIVSWGRKCAEPYPGIYTSVSKFIPWIGSQIVDASP